jgi:hypothetical protein
MKEEADGSTFRKFPELGSADVRGGSPRLFTQDAGDDELGRSLFVVA